MNDLRNDCNAMAAKLGQPEGGGFLYAVIGRAQQLAEATPGADPEELLRTAFEQCMERQRHLLLSNDRDAVIFRRVLGTSVYHTIRARQEMDGVQREVEQIAAEEIGDHIQALRIQLDNVL